MSNENKAAPPAVAGELPQYPPGVGHNDLIFDLREDHDADFKEKHPIDALHDYERERHMAADALAAMQARVSELERERDDAIEQIILVKGCADYHKSQECMEIQNEIIAQRDAAQARIAALEEAINAACNSLSGLGYPNIAFHLRESIARAALKGGET